MSGNQKRALCWKILMCDFNLRNYLDFWAKKTDSWLNGYFKPWSIYSAGLTEAMRYSLFAGGKRLRPALIFSSYGIFESYFDKVIPYAGAVEMLHTYSLIHDDLPAMDDDDLRRGKPTNHKVFGEATAILAGDALLTKSFEVMTDREINPDIPVEMMLEATYKLAVATGDRGMVAGQYADIVAENGNFGKESLEFIHRNKTAALVGYCTELGAILGFGSNDEKKSMKKFGEKIGLAFQITDDVLDVTSTTEALGKDAKSDLEKNKVTYVSVYGVENSKKMAEKLVEESLDILESFGEASRPLREIALYIISRSN